ncbi:MAG: LysR family transcriptional regulator [Rhodobacteraceae bacterium]|nr:LysR family transcriptional regulator [Paracoccaceae bacterium]
MPLRFSLRQLEYLVAVAETGTVAGAAARARVSPPSVSAAIAQLEADLGLPLFVRRHARGLTLTPAGRAILADARAVLAAASRIVDHAGEIRGSVQGRLAVGCLVTFARTVLPAVRRSFVDRHPAVEFSQVEHDQAGLLEGLRDAAIDIALTYDLGLPADLDFIPLVTLPAHAVLPEGHPLAARAALGPADLAPEPLVLLDLPMSADYFLTFFAGSGLTPRIAERTRDLDVARGLVANGFGWSIANFRPVSDRAPDGRGLAFVPLAGPIRPMRMGLLPGPGALSSHNVRAFADHCRAEITPGSIPGLRAPARGPD